MTNHLHLMASADSIAAIPRAIQGLGRRYVSYFNLRHGRVGTLWQGRYRSSIIASERYLYACHRYIEMNPVRAGLVAHPREYRWSSHGFYALGRGDSLVSPHSCLGWEPGEWPGRGAFLALFDQTASAAELSEIRNAGRRGTALGDLASCRALEARIGRRVTPRSPGRRSGRVPAGDGQTEMVV
jgi:putative transposase